MYLFFYQDSAIFSVGKVYYNESGPKKCNYIYIQVEFKPYTIKNFCTKLPLHVMEVFFSNVY